MIKDVVMPKARPANGQEFPKVAARGATSGLVASGDRDLGCLRVKTGKDVELDS